MGTNSRRACGGADAGPEYEELASVVEAARSLNFYERVRALGRLRRIIAKRKDARRSRRERHHDRGGAAPRAGARKSTCPHRRGSPRRSLTRCRRVKFWHELTPGPRDAMGSRHVKRARARGALFLAGPLREASPPASRVSLSSRGGGGIRGAFM